MMLFRPRNQQENHTPTNNNDAAAAATAAQVPVSAFDGDCDPIFCSSDKTKSRSAAARKFFQNNNNNSSNDDDDDDDDDELPEIQAVASYESTFTAASSVSPTSTSSMGSTRTTFQVEIQCSDITRTAPPAIETVASYDDDEEEEAEESMNAIYALKVETRTSQSSQQQQQQYYFSRDELETLLTPRFLEDLEDAVEEEQTDQEKDRQLRKELIQRELDALVQATAAQMKMEEAEQGGGGRLRRDELEPEAIEALGIAAHRVAYQKRYYDVPSCQYIYVPSVAYTILNGTLLEEASKHYFGEESSSEEFLVAYAAQLGSTILQNQQPHVLQIRGEEDCNDDADLSDVDFLSPRSSDSSPSHHHHDATSSSILCCADSCFGVSPTQAFQFFFEESSSSSSTHDPTTTLTIVEEKSNKQLSRHWATSSVVGAAAAVFLASSSLAMMTMMRPQLWDVQPPTSSMIITSIRSSTTKNHHPDNKASGTATTNTDDIVSPVAPLFPFSMDEDVFRALESMRQSNQQRQEDGATSTSTHTCTDVLSKKDQPVRTAMAKTKNKGRQVVANLLY